ncbi:MAG: HAMP domain-containing histidine kinase [Anaeromicrobium sp.]|jgi:signal transduction histidine kinase|uniref:sensor histidine kinase n=1 Tax=Anaeromicrobium sp. TaxID=1929132 RepID=UPI0025F95CF1|nr:HAMP domain-containing sensor histidine kinase [Anaeromicrobium sp.]MCT4594410.1 HAMP domain-containing histidine kinase [Anaeromicrobium sp.]
MDKKKFFTIHSLATKFFLNYILLFIILIAILFSTVVGSIYLIFRQYSIPLITSEEVYANVENYGIEKGFSKSNLPDNAYIELLDKNLVVKNQYNSIHKVGYEYSYEDFRELEMGGKASKDVFYPPDKNTILLTVNPNYDDINSKFIVNTFKKSFFFLILSYLLVFLIFAKVTSTSIIKPIKKLVKGVDEISKGNYRVNVDFKSKNELQLLKNSINNMAHKINEEISLREKSEANRKRLILDISHDLKTPLTNIIGYAETLYEQKDYSKKYLEIIVSNSKKANNLIQDLFELSHMESGNYSIDLEERDICEFIRQVLIDFIPEFEEKNIEYDFHIPDNRIFLKFNPNKLERAINNLINNSIKYSPKNNTITLKLLDFNNYISIIIEDIGPGIDKSIGQDIFEPFVRKDKSRSSQTGGTGLGLSITRAIIELHGGTITLDTSYDEGSRFSIDLPKK